MPSTNHKSVTKRLLVAGAAVVAVAGALLTVPSPADAARQEELVVTREKGRFTIEYGGIPGAFPATGDPEFDRLRDPDTCATADYCDTIPLRIQVPSVGTSDDVRVHLTLDLLDPAEDCCVDLDFYLWDNKQQKENPAAEESPYSQIQTSTTAGSLEKVSLANPGLDAYNLTVVAWLGPVSGYKITAEMFVDSFEPPFELLEPEPAAPTSPDEPSSPPATEAPLPPPADPGPSPRPTLGTIDADLDDSLEIEVPSIEDQLAAGQFDFQPAADAEDFGPVSTAALLATLLALPAVVAAGGGAWFLRRRRSLSSV